MSKTKIRLVILFLLFSATPAFANTQGYKVSCFEKNPFTVVAVEVNGTAATVIIDSVNETFRRFNGTHAATVTSKPFGRLAESLETSWNKAQLSWGELHSNAQNTFDYTFELHSTRPTVYGARIKSHVKNDVKYDIPLTCNRRSYRHPIVTNYL